MRNVSAPSKTVVAGALYFLQNQTASTIGKNKDRSKVTTENTIVRPDTISTTPFPITPLLNYHNCRR
jgi:hypothetical protein